MYVLRLCGVHLLCMHCGCAMYTSYVCTVAVWCTPPMYALRLCGVHLLCMHCSCVMYTSYVCTAAVWCTPPMYALRLCDVHLLCMHCGCVMYTSYVCKMGSSEASCKTHCMGTTIGNSMGRPCTLNGTSTPL